MALRAVGRESLMLTSTGARRLVLLAAVAAAAAPFLFPGVIGRVLDDEYMPHGHCYLWERSLVTLHVATDSLIALAYVAISLTLAYFVGRARHDVPFRWVFVAFGAFIIACGATHFMEVVTLWVAVYWLSGSVKLVTAL